MWQEKHPLVWLQLRLMQVVCDAYNLLIVCCFGMRGTFIREGGRDGEPASTVLVSFILDVCLKFNWALGPSEDFSSLEKFLIPKLISPGCLRIKPYRALNCLHSFFSTKSLAENWNWFKHRRDIIYVTLECFCTGGLEVHKRAVVIALFVEVTGKISSLSIFTWSCFLFTLLLYIML